MTDDHPKPVTRREINTALAKALALGVLGRHTAGAAPSGASTPTVRKKGHSTGTGAPTYRIYPLRNGMLKIGGHHAFLGGNEEETFDYALYVFLILGGERPMLVDAGLNDVAEMNRGAAKVLREPITQRPEETVRAQLSKFGLTPEDIGHVFITHLHFDHVDGLTDLTNAKVYVGKKEWELGSAWGHGGIVAAFNRNPQWKRRLVLVEDQQILPGIESFWIGGHTLGSTAYAVNTAHGKVALTGDTVSLLANIEKNIPVGVCMNQEECAAGMKKIRERADIVLPSHDPDTLDRWPPAPKHQPKYSIRAIKVGQCEVRDYITFHDTDSQATRTYYLYVWVIEGSDRPVIVETGPNPKYVQGFNRATAQYIPGGIKQRPEEDTIVALKRHGIEPADVRHVIVTHLHGDHYDYFDAFPNARLVVNTTEFEENVHRLNRDVMKAITSRRGALQLVENEEIVPGVRTVPLGCHTSGSQGVLVQTHMGPVMLTGDVVYMYENIETNRPGRSRNKRECLDAMAKIRSLADIVLPAHDPLTLERWPGGVIGGKPADGQ